MDNLTKAKNLIENTSAVFAAVSDCEICTSDKKGIAALLSFYENEKDFKDFSIADRIIGKAAAMLMCMMNASTVYAKIISRHALEVFNKYKVDITYGEICDYVKNRAGDGICPMEEVALRCDTTEENLVKLLKKRLEELKNR